MHSVKSKQLPQQETFTYARIFCKSVLLTILAALTGCSTWSNPPQQSAQNTAYLQAKSVTPVNPPADLSSKNLANSYPIPPATNQEMLSPPPSIVPPGSGLAPTTPSPLTLKPAATVTPGPVLTAGTTAPVSVVPPKAAPTPSTLSSAPTGPVTVTINADYSQAWDKVGHALQTSGYRVLQQDSSLGRYYVLDLGSTNGQLRRNTPIYQVHLIEIGNGKTQLTLLDAHNQAVDGNVARRILGAVQNKLSN